MAELNKFLGGLVSSISEARVNSDLQSLKIAQEYAKDELLKHFAVPTMRVEKVEFNIPVAIDNLVEKSQKVYEPIDNKSFSSKTYQQILKSLEMNSLSNEVSKSLRTSIAEHIHLLEAKIKVSQIENALKDFSNNIASKVIELAVEIFKETERKINVDWLTKLQNRIIKTLQATLKEEIKYKTEIKVLESLQVIVEAHKLREIKPENVIMIKMTVTEQGMQWIKSENSKGEVVNDLMPE